MSDSQRPTRPPSPADPTLAAGLDRRAFLRATGAVALGGALGACGDDALPAGSAELDASEASLSDLAPDTTTEPPHDTSAPEIEPDTAPASDLVEVGDQHDPGDPPETHTPALSPVRGDGSSLLHYIEHIVIVQMENRSFDHYFGALSLVEGRGDVDGLAAGMGNHASDGSFIPVTPADGLWVLEPDPPHSHGACVDQFADGTNAGFVTTYQSRAREAHLLPRVMSYFVREELPALYHLADHFTLCDRWHCSLLGPTWPNRFYSHAATSEGLWTNLIPLATPTIYSAALAAGVSYGVYHHSPIYFALTMLDPVAGSYPAPDLDVFFDDARDGILPNLTVVEPDYSLNDDHPPQDIRLGQAFIASIYEALRQSPKWDRTLLLVFYDEHGGFYDHVVPPRAQGESRASLGFDQLGFRVPAIVAGGLAGRGKVLRELVEHSSVPALIARTFGLPHVNERAELAGDLSLALDRALVVDAARPAPPPIPPIALSSRRLEAALAGRFNQPELLSFAQARGHRLGSLADKRRRTARWLERAAALGAVRLT